MATEVEYALMAGRIYQSNRGKINWLPDLLSFGWTERVDKSQSLPSGFEATYFTKGTEIVISYAGTGSNVDWWANAGGFFGVTTEQLRQAADYYLQVKAAHPGAIIHLTGHSLGGGLASLMAVFFDESAVTFDQAPFRNSASVSVATTLKEYLLNERGYSQAALQRLTNFISDAVGGGVPNNNNVIDFSVQGEILSSASGLRIGVPTSWTHGAPDLSGISLHSHALLTAFLQSDRTAPGQQSLSDVTFKLPDVVRMISDSNLYAFPTALNSNQENFIERLVRHQNGVAGLKPGEIPINADAMLTRFTRDLWKLAQDGGLTMADGPTPATNLVSKALIAFAMQMYYENTANATTATKELFTNLATENTGSGGIRFDRADVVATLNDAKGYNDFHFYLVNNFSAADRQRIEDLLPVLRDWYVQAGSGGMNATDTQSRGAFMLGGRSADSLTGGAGNDLLVGNTGFDSLTGGGGTDTLLGGAGFDRYYYTTGDGNDRIEDSDADGAIFVNGQLLMGGVKKAGHTDWTSPDGTITYVMQGTDLVVKLNDVTILTVNENFQSGQFGIKLIDAPTVSTQLPTTTRTIVGDYQPLDIDPDLEWIQVGYDDLGNIIPDLENPNDRSDLLNGSAGNDTINGGAMNDRLTALGGNDILTGGTDSDILIGQDGNDQLFADQFVNVSGLTNFENFGGTAGTGVKGDFLTGGMNDDVLVGGAGNDALYGGAGKDLVLGGAGRDVISGDSDFVAANFGWSYSFSDRFDYVLSNSAQLSDGYAKG